MNRTRYLELHRTARLGNLGTLTATAGGWYYWFLEQVYDLRFPHVGDNRHTLPPTFDSLRVSTARRLAWRRQRDYCAGIKWCSRCKSEHHERHGCNH